LLKGGKEKQKTQDEMWVFAANGSVRQPHSSAFASFTFLQVFLFAKVLWAIWVRFNFFRAIKFLLKRVPVSAERSDADLYQDRYTF
jgi:hypothetical protein